MDVERIRRGGKVNKADKEQRDRHIGEEARLMNQMSLSERVGV